MILLQLHHNIIAQAEFRYQRYVIATSRSAIGWIIVAIMILAPAILASFGLFINGILGYNMRSTLAYAVIYARNFDPEALAVVAFLVMNIALYAVVTLVTLGLSARSITRERTNHTWEILLLTHIDARQLVWGKWWASLKALNGDHLLIALLRLGLVGVVVSIPYHDAALAARLFHTLILTLGVLAFTVLDAGFSAAVGVAIPLSNLPSSIAASLVVGIRMAIVGYAYLFASTVHDVFVSGGSYLVVLASGLILMAGFVWLMLRAAEFSAVCGQVTETL